MNTKIDTSTIEGKIAVMDAATKGSVIEYCDKSNKNKEWAVPYGISWDWHHFDYRICMIKNPPDFPDGLHPLPPAPKDYKWVYRGMGWNPQKVVKYISHYDKYRGWDRTANNTIPWATPNVHYAELVKVDPVLSIDSFPPVAKWVRPENSIECYLITSISPTNIKAGNYFHNFSDLVENNWSWSESFTGPWIKFKNG